jgi:hypothetical protein
LGASGFYTTREGPRAVTQVTPGRNYRNYRAVGAG